MKGNADFILLTFLFLLSGGMRCPADPAGIRTRFVFYNTENFFDPFDDPLTDDDEFTPEGVRHWTYGRFMNKVRSLSKVIMAAGEGEVPGLVALCEVENAWVLRVLIDSTALSAADYEFIHFDSPDERGIDVALLYRPSVFRPFHSRPVAAAEESSGDQTRDILLVSGILFESDTLHLLISHWPSRYGGVAASRTRREYAARIARSLCDSLLAAGEDQAVLLAGDLNDEDSDRSIKDVLGLREPTEISDPVKPGTTEGLYHLSPEYAPGVYGTTRYRDFWYFFDHIFVSRALLRPGGLTLEDRSQHVFCPGFLLEEDRQYGGSRPKRTYRGYRYEGGFSDHLPVYIGLLRKDLVKQTSFLRH